MFLTPIIVALKRNKWITSFIGAAVLAALVWFCGPMLGIGEMHPLDLEWVRILVIVAIFVLWLILNLVRIINARHKDKQLAESVAAAAAEPDADKTASAEEVALLGDRLKEAMLALRKAKLGGRSRTHLYQLPWYMFIGPPGAGKTTALTHCGLRFPLAEADAGTPGGGAGPQALRGVGGTRNCDWWFTDEAVMIDTAGRYTTQDSHAAVDGAAWLGFLRLLKKHRKRQPINGVLVAISLSDLATTGETERLLHARAVRKRVRELHEELGVRIPVYVLFTKADLIAGFTEFFDSFGKEEREQVWGVTFPLDNPKDERGAVAGFAPAFDALLTRLNDRMLERVHQEPDLHRRRLIYGFPQQMASMRDVADEFLNEAFRPSRLEARTLLRGVYMTSGTQDGTPIDRLLGAMSSQFGLPRQAVTAFSGGGRSYFLARLVREVVFGEAALVTRDPRVERRVRWTWRAAYAGSAVALIGLTAFWATSYLGNAELVTQTQDAIGTYQTQYAELLKRGPRDADLPPTLPPLHTLRAMPGGYDARDAATPIALTFGLYQGSKLSAGAMDSYYRALDGILLPRLLARLESQMQFYMDKPDVLYGLLKVYLVLGRQGPLNKELVQQWFDADIARTFPGDERAEMREALSKHVEAMLERPLNAPPLNGPLVAQAREVLNRQPFAEYSYARILNVARVKQMPEWTVAEAAGPGSARVFQLRSGKPLDSGVPGIYTWTGYHKFFLPLLTTLTQDIAEDGWVLGLEKRGVSGEIAAVSKLRRDVLGLYFNDYTRRWDALLADIAVKPFGNLNQALDELSTLSAPDSPLRDLWTSIDQQTQLSRQDSADAAAGKAAGKASSVGQKLTGIAAFEARAGLSMNESMIASALTSAFGAGPDGKPVDPATRVDEHFRDIHAFVAGGEGKPAPLEETIRKVLAVYQTMNQAANAPSSGQALLGMVGGGGGGGGGAGAAAQLAEVAKDLPKPVAAMLQTVASSSSSVAASGASTELTNAWKSKVLPLCQQALNRYPLVAGSASDVPIDDFVHLLGPGGMIDQFFDQNLKTLVDTSATPWRAQAADHVPLALAPGTLAQFEHAAHIREALFASGGSQLSVKFQLTLDRLGAGVAKVVLEIGGRSLTADGGPQQPTAFVWPSPQGDTQVRLTMVPTGGGNETVVEQNGAWALLRLIDGARTSGKDERATVTFTTAAGSATFQLTAASVRNPFTFGELHAFRCPASL